MAEMREIKRRIKSVDNTRQITKTMEMVAGAKIKKAQDSIEKARPYASKMIEVLSNVSGRVDEKKYPLLDVHEPVKHTTIVVFTSDRGLCGAFNANVIRRAEELIKEEEEKGRGVELITVGRKGISYFTYVGQEILSKYDGISDSPTFENAREIAKELEAAYIAYQTDQVILVFNQFKSAVEQKITEHILLPVGKEIMEEEREAEAPVFTQEFIFEPSSSQVFEKLLPTYVETLAFRVLLESAASEHGARRTAMKAATENAGEMIKDLVVSFNRARQAQITQEISEIVGGAEALK